MFKLKKGWLGLLVLISGLYSNSKGEVSYNEAYPLREKPEPTRWVDPEGRLPTPFNQTRDYQVYISSLNRMEPNETRLYPAPRPGSSNTDIYVVVDESIYSSITDSLNQYKTNLENSGFSVAIHLCSGCTAGDVRSLLQQGLPDGLMGAVLVGYIPSAWYETDCQWDEPPDPPTHEEFPIDLYYMDLDGNWTDADADGMYDGHDNGEGDVAPEIWVGRLRAPDWPSEVELLQNYFDKNDKYRNGNYYSLPYRALVYIDDDWADVKADIWDAAVGLVYDDRTLVKDKATTNAADYLNRLAQNYEFNHVAVHSSSWAHRFMINHQYPDGWVHWHEIRDTDPHIYFHNLYACSAARYIEENYIGGWYIFADTYGLTAVGSTKIGAMYMFEEFYGPLSENKNIGEAFKEWFILHGESNRCFFYGLTILGDPTLKLLGGDRLVDWWKLDEESGPTAPDSVGDNHGTLVGDPTWLPTGGKVNGALELDTDDYVELSSMASLEGDNVTVAAWILINEQDTGNSLHPIVSQYEYDNPNYYGYLLYLKGNEPRFFLGGAGATVSGDSVNASEWYHLVGTNDGSELKIYVNGEQKGTPESSFGHYGSDRDAYIGYNGDNYFGAIINGGRIDDVRVYNYALSKFEIWDTMSGELPRFRVKNSSDETVAWFDSFGNLFLEGSKYTGAGWKEPSGTNDEFIVEDGSGPIVYIDELGDLYLREGDVIEKTTPTLSGADFRIQDSSEADVAVINPSDGKVYLKGELYQNPEQ